jgi:hypothetical protein
MTLENPEGFKSLLANEWTKVCYYYSSFDAWLKEVYKLSDEDIEQLYGE